MANIKTTTQIDIARYGVIILGACMALFGFINIFLTMTPIAASNLSIDAHFESAQKMSVNLRLPVYVSLRDTEERNLSKRPSDPYGWARLSYLRFVTTGDEKSAFNALSMSNFISPYEILELPERAVTWYRYRAAETKEQQAYQDSLWQKAYMMAPDNTWNIAVQNKLTHEAEDALKRRDIALYNDWKGRENNAPHDSAVH